MLIKTKTGAELLREAAQAVLDQTDKRAALKLFNAELIHHMVARRNESGLAPEIPLVVKALVHLLDLKALPFVEGAPCAFLVSHVPPEELGALLDSHEKGILLVLHASDAGYKPIIATTEGLFVYKNSVAAARQAANLPSMENPWLN